MNFELPTSKSCEKENAVLTLLCLPSLLALAVLAFEWSIIDWVTGFLFGPIQSTVGVLLIASVAATVALLVRQKRWRRPKFYSPLAAVGIVILAAIFVPFTDLWLAWDFKSNREERESVAKAIFDGRITPNYAHNSRLIALPETHRDVSRGGGDVVFDIIGTSRSVYFFTYRGILGSSSGYVFMEKDETPQQSDIVYVHKIAPHWYWIQTS